MKTIFAPFMDSGSTASRLRLRRGKVVPIRASEDCSYKFYDSSSIIVRAERCRAPEPMPIYDPSRKPKTTFKINAPLDSLQNDIPTLVHRNSFPFLYGLARAPSAVTTRIDICAHRDTHVLPGTLIKVLTYYSMHLIPFGGQI